MRIFRNQAQWQTLIEDQQTSDLTITDYCHLHQLATSGFYAARNKMANIPSAFVRTKVTKEIEVLTTPPPTRANIDSIAKEGIRFTDHYALPYCTAGRVAFITGQYPIRSGMATLGQPGDSLGLQAKSPSLAEVLKSVGYATGHCFKNHLGERNEHLPTVHGFDEFFGNL
jgi:arylsulfatase A-like enzyme